ncbi:hypothetical protein VTL71DRAFT_963 [Oculimacula yallundae]|uniref:Uncharacterized protein n=1 Tax=Oculimacula yallundae TaxID=86028 RepID=A0ABR4D1N8_9HELO
MNTSQLSSNDCKVKVRKYVLVSKPSRLQQKRGRVVVQSPLLNITKDVLFVPVRVLHGKEYNLVCYLPRADIERDSSDAYRRQHASNTPSFIEAHGSAICDSDPSDNFVYSQNDRFWIYVDSKTNEYIDKIPVINLRTFQSGAVPIDHVCWFPRIQSTTWCPVAEARCEQLWTPGGPIREQKLIGSNNYTLWSFVICQFTNGAGTIARTVRIPAKDDESQESHYLSRPESASYFLDRRQHMMIKLHSNSLSQQLEISLPTPPASPELIIIKDTKKGKAKVPLPAAPIQAPPSEVNSVWMRIKDLADCRGSRNSQYVLKNSSIHPRTHQSVESSMYRGHSSSMSVPPSDYDSHSDSYSDSMGSYSRDVSPPRVEGVDEDKLRKYMDGQQVNTGIILKELLKFRPNEDHGERSDGLAFSAADPSIAKDPTRIFANWDANKPSHNPNLDNLCQNGDPHCPYTTKATCKHYHPDPSKCQLNKQARLELHDPEPANLSREWRAWAQANRSITQDRQVDHEHCIARLRPYPAGAGDCMLAGNPLKTHVCCLWDPKDLDGLPQNFTRAYTKSKVADAERHRLTIFDQSALVKTESRLVDFGLVDDSLSWGGKTLLRELDEGILGEDLGYLKMDTEMVDVGTGLQALGQMPGEFGEALF